jgi:D-proline reductase (dithiol) PrdB
LRRAYQAGDIQEAVKRYPLIVSEDVPWTPYWGRPAEQTLAVVTSGGVYLKNSQPPFDIESIHGDPSFREIPGDVRQQDLAFAHAHYDHNMAEQDFNVILPLRRLAELEAEGVLGKAADTHYSFSYVNDVVPLVTKSVPQLIRRLKAEKVDILLLVPV